MVPVTVLGMLALAPGQSYGIGEFKHALLTDVGMTEMALSWVYGIATFIAGLTAMLAGAAMDRFGLRLAITVSVLMLAASCLFASQVNGVISVFFAFLLLRIFGHGALPLMTGTTLAMWFRRRLGFVTGLTGVVGTAASAGIPFLYLALIETFSWRQAWMFLGVGTGVVMLPVMFLVFRNRPEDVGQRVDGAADATAGTDDRADANPLVHFDPSAARRTRAYWCLVALHAAHGMVFAAVMFHRVQIFAEREQSAQQAATMFLLFSICSAVMQLVGGLLADRVPLRLMLAGSSCLVAAGLFVLGFAEGIGAAYLFGALYGLGTGTEIVGRHTAWPRFFGTDHIGKIKSTGAMAAVLGSSVGPLVAAFFATFFRSFAPAVVLMAAIYGAVALAMLSARNPQPRGT